MEYSLTDLVRLSDLSVDTIRYYQSFGLLPKPAHCGRTARYDDSHLDRLRQIRSAAQSGLSLRVIRELLAKGRDLSPDQALLLAVETEEAEPRYTREQTARMLELPVTLLKLVEELGLVRQDRTSRKGDARYSEADLRMGRRMASLLRHGFPVAKLMALALRHDQAVKETVDEAIDLFNEYVRQPAAQAGVSGASADRKEDGEAVARAFKDIFPAVSALVALHFQRTLVSRALERLRKHGSPEALELARRAVLEVEERLRER